MEGKNRTIFVVLIAVVIVVAVFSSFGLNLFMPGTPDVYLPDVTDSAGEDPGPGGTGDPDRYVRVDVTPETVQDVIRTMVPLQPKSFHRTVKVQTALGDGTMGTTTNNVWEDFGWTMVESVWPSGVTEHTIVGDGKVYRWFSGDWTYKEWDGEDRDANMAQRIPTYEDVLDLDKKLITATGYEDRDGLPCVYVEVGENELGNRERYWVSVESGLLVAAETRKGEETILLMSSGTVESPVQQGKSFALPDGTVLHTVGS
ncbi:conserved exported hypothetical protein [uncultured Eubacteriales bacterium]|uniref:Uncharacterized protein n=1 Tax=uncultured Eubacteriales bacterium TaxID=172733 RepID=A0A212K0W7_9FIRM|nr:conserved exported hypothetical protein [uncultured Eubacteriales bacterium]